MIDQDLERRTAECTELMEYWRQFLDLIYRAVKPPQTITPQLEQQFLSVKARVAMLHDSFMEALKHDRGTGQAMIDIVNRAITLRLMTKVSESEVKKIEIEWHEVFLLLNETVTSLNEERARLADINEFTYNLKKRQERFAAQFKSFVRSIWFKIGATIVVIAFILFGIPAFGIYDYDNLRDIKAMGFACKAYLNATRDIGFDSAYYSHESFMKYVPNETDKMDGINKIETVTKDQKQGDIIPNLNFLNSDNQAILKGAQGYDLIKYSGRTRNQDVYMIIFWLRKTKDARTIDFASTQVTMPSDTEIYRKANVLLILKGKDQSLREAIKAEVIDELKPR